MPGYTSDRPSPLAYRRAKIYVLFLVGAVFMGLCAPAGPFVAAYFADFSAPVGAAMSDGATVTT